MPVAHGSSSSDTGKPNDPVVEVKIIYERPPGKVLNAPAWLRHLFTAWMWWGALCTYGICVSGAMLLVGMCFVE